jgi:hypothetical protein
VDQCWKEREGIFKQRLVYRHFSASGESWDRTSVLALVLFRVALHLCDQCINDFLVRAFTQADQFPALPGRLMDDANEPKAAYCAA